MTLNVSSSLIQSFVLRFSFVSLKNQTIEQSKFRLPAQLNKMSKTILCLFELLQDSEHTVLSFSVVAAFVEPARTTNNFAVCTLTEGDVMQRSGPYCMLLEERLHQTTKDRVVKALIV